jgi:FG-GAP-like repeat
MKYGLILSALLVAPSAYFLLMYEPGSTSGSAVVLPAVEAAPPEADSERVHAFCGSCHAYPPPETFPRVHWPEEVRRAYDFFRDSDVQMDAPDLERVVAYYQKRAPLALPAIQQAAVAARPLPVMLERAGFSPPDRPRVAGVTNVHLAHLSRPDRLDLLVCHFNPGRIWAVKPYDDPPSWHLLGDVQAPCHVEVVDLDGDGRKDLLVADLGSFYPTDDRTGRVVWLRNDGEGRFTPIVLLDGVGRVADVQAADFNGDGKLDLIVAEFGWRHGAVLYLENQTTDWAHPSFRRTVLDGRAGAIHVPVGDINGDGHPDVVALLAQESETVLAFLGDGKGGFTKKTIFAAPHPAYGSSGIQLVDLDGDGDLDVLYTNGDSLDPPSLLKPYHGIQWLENRGEFPFVHHHVEAQYGVMRAVAADIDGDGAMDIVAVAFLPPENFPTAQQQGAEAVQILRQVAPGRFERHVVDTGVCSHLTCAVGDIFGTGRADVVVGNFFVSPAHARGDLLTVWRNGGRR